MCDFAASSVEILRCVYVCMCVCVPHIKRSGLNHTQLYTGLPVRYVVTKRYKVNRSHHGNKIATKSLPGSTTRGHGKLIRVKTIVIGYELQLLLSELQATEKTAWCGAHPTTSSKTTQTSFLAVGRLHEDKLCNGIDQCQNGSSNLLTPYRE